MTAENRPTTAAPSAAGCFNEAAADDRGKLSDPRYLMAAREQGFNEAAADDRGKRAWNRTRSACRGLLQ